jgi:CheY-like chemotaxis protein
MQPLSGQSAEPIELRPLLFVIEDDEVLRTETVLLLEDRGYDVVDCADAQAALDRLHTGAVPDLILLDLILPVMDGWEFRVQQKRVAEWADIPVITMSADRTVKMGAIDAQVHLTKPFESEHLLKAVDEQLHTVERKRLEQRSRRRAQLGLLGRMAASVAYETDNPITFVLSSLELAQKQCKELEARLPSADAFSLVGIRQLLTRGARGAEHIASMAQRMSVFAAADADELRAVDVAEVIDATLQLVRNELRGICRVERELSNLPTITTYPGKLALALLNLFLTALQSMRAVSDRHHVLRVAVSAAVSNTLTISISDTGSGLGSHVLSLSSGVEPFSSNRARLTEVSTELALSCELVRELGGLLKAENNSSAGSLFEIILPVQTSSTGKRRAMVGSAPSPVADRARPRILLVAGDPMICRLLVSLLARAYEVVTITQPAIALVRLLGEEWFDVILCDLLLPERKEMPWYERTILENPALEKRFIFMADEPLPGSVRSIRSAARRPVLRKPFQYDELVDMIEALLSTKH